MKRFLTLFLLLLPFCVFANTAEDIRQASKLYFERNQQEALEKFIEISKTTGDKEAFLNVAYIALELGNPRLAVDTISIALKKFPTDTQVLEFAGDAYLANGYFLNAENVFARLTEKSEKTEFYYISLARAQMGMEQYDLAEINLKQAALGTNHISLSNFMLGELYSKKGDYRAAADAYKKVVDYDSQFLEAKKRYGDALAKLKRYDEAWKSYSSVQAADSRNTQVAVSIAEIRPLVTPEEKELIDIPTIPQKHTIIRRPVSYDGKLPEIRVGVGAKINGVPAGMSSIKFSTSHKFKAINEKGKTIVNGTSIYYWQVAVIDRKAYIISPSGKKTPFTSSIKIVQESPDDNAHTTILRNMLVGHGTTWSQRQTKEYRGTIEFVYNKNLNGIIPINHVNIEEYVYGVISSEMPSRFPIEALKAQAIIARTYALKSIGKHKSWGYDVCDTQNCQVYGGVTAERERTNAAADGTMGLVLTHKGRPIEAVFSSNCGGFTQSSKEAGWFPHPYLQPVSDYKEDIDVDNLQPYMFKELLQHTHPAYSRYFKYVSPSTFRWTRYVEEEQIRNLVKRRKNIGEIRAIIPLNRGYSGYVSGVRIVGTKGTLVLNKENEIKRYLAMGMLRSTYFLVQPNFENGIPKSFIFYGGGWGHGVGLCQTGSGGRADAGQNFEQILYHYYTDTKIQDIRKK